MRGSSQTEVQEGDAGVPCCHCSTMSQWTGSSCMKLRLSRQPQFPLGSSAGGRVHLTSSLLSQGLRPGRAAWASNAGACSSGPSPSKGPF